MKNKYKKIKSYLLRVVLFSLTIKYFFIQTAGITMCIFFPFLMLFDYFNNIYLEKNYSYYFDEFQILSKSIDNSVVFIAFLTMYLLAKVFGIFKKLDKINFFISLGIICLLSYLLILIGKINFLMDTLSYNDGLKYSYTMYTLIPAFVLYKFFGFLTKKFPVPFEKFGYWSSKEFWGGLVRKCWERIRVKR